MSGFLLGVLSTIVFIVLILPLISKLIMKWAVKKQANLLIGDVQRKIGNLSKLMNPEPTEEPKD